MAASPAPVSASSPSDRLATSEAVGVTARPGAVKKVTAKKAVAVKMKKTTVKQSAR